MTAHKQPRTAPPSIEYGKFYLHETGRVYKAISECDSQSDRFKARRLDDRGLMYLPHQRTVSRLTMIGECDPQGRLVEVKP